MLSHIREITKKKPSSIKVESFLMSKLLNLELSQSAIQLYYFVVKALDDFEVMKNVRTV